MPRRTDDLGRSEDLGTITPGKCADLVVLDGDPLRDFDVMRTPRLVLKDGVVVYRAPAAGVPLQL